MIQRNKEGRAISVSPVFGPDDLKPGMEVRIFRNVGKGSLLDAWIERVHTFTREIVAESMGIQPHIHPTNTYYDQGRLVYISDDGNTVDSRCDTGGRCCIHVRYRNGVRGIVHIAYVRPLEAIDELARLVR